MSMRLLTAAVFALVLAACGEFAVPDSKSVPASPTWNGQVQQILNDHCVRCHGAEPNRGAPRDFRLDTYADAGGVVGAATMAGEIDEVVQNGEMPQEQPLGPNDTAIIKKWNESGAPEK